MAIRSFARSAFSTVLAVVLLAGCGGGDDGGSGGDAQEDFARAASAAGVIVVGDSARAQAATLGLARIVIGVSGLGGSPSCGGGGYAIFTASAGNPATLFNGVPDTGERYTINFVNCRSSSNSALANGTLSLTVVSASGENYVLATDADVIVALPERTVSLEGQSTLTHTEVTQGASHIVTDRWQSPAMSVRSVRNNRPSRLALTDVDWTQTATTTGGVTSYDSDGHVTMSYDGWFGRWSATVTTDGAVRFAINGLPLDGRWRITLPQDLILVTIANSEVRAALDFGRNGTVERLLLWPIRLLLDFAY